MDGVADYPRANVPRAPHALLRDVLPPTEHAELLDWTIRHEADFAPARIYARGVQRMRRANLACDRKVFQPWKTRLRDRFGALLPQLAIDLGMPAFEADQLELELTSYGEGGFFKRHIDTVTGEQALSGANGVRVLSAVYYFHREPQGFTGGALRLFPLRHEHDAHFVNVPPQNNSLTAFPSWVRHEVCPVQCSSGAFADTRFAINCWARRRLPTAVPRA